MQDYRRIGWAYLLAGGWIALTVSLASWWLIFGLAQARELGRIGGEAERLAGVQRMLTWEGAALIALLLGGGGALLMAIRRERARNREVREFFLSFTHDLKTALASVRLQAESLEEDGDLPAGHPNLARLLQDAVRLELQLENSLFFAQADVGLLREPLGVEDVVNEAATDWPDLDVHVTGTAVVRADRRALQSVLRNVLQNAATHGQAKRVEVAIGRGPDGVKVTITDDGVGAPPGVTVDTSRPFSRPASTSGTGIGLYVSRCLLERMRGALACRAVRDHGFEVELSLPEAA